MPEKISPTAATRARETRKNALAGRLVVLTVALAIVKLTGLAALGWWTVLAPLWVPFVASPAARLLGECVRAVREHAKG